MSQSPLMMPATVLASAADRAAPRAPVAVLKIAVLAVEVLIVTLVVLGRIDLFSALGAHLGLGLMLVAVIFGAERLGYYAGDLQKFALQMIVAGPLGSASALIDEQLSSRTRTEHLTKWYDTIAPEPRPAVTLADRIRDDQVVRSRARLPRSAARLIVRGSMREKQALFASVVADGRMEGMSLIEEALRSRDQQVRVQAAAVSAFLRSKVRSSTGMRHALTGKVELPVQRLARRPAMGSDMISPAA